MFCEKCGTKLEDGSLFCDNCGAKLADMTMIPPAADNVKEEYQTPAQAAPTPQAAPQGYGQAVYQQPQGYQPVPAAPKKPMAMLTKIFIIEAVVLVALVIAFFKLGQTAFSSEHVAENYAKAKMAGDWEAVYEMLNLPTSALLTEEMFMTTRTDEELQEIDNYEINEVESNNFRTSYVCEYMTTGDSYSNSETIILVKQRDKQWLFFEEWKVTPDNMLVEDNSITIPNDATLFINGTDVSTLAGVEKEEYNNTITYILPKMFRGTYDIEVQAPGRKTYSETVDIEYYFSRSYTNLEPDADAVKELVAVNEKLCSSFFSAIMEGKSYDDFYAEHSDEFGEDVDFRSFYEDWLSNFQNDDYHQYQKLSVNCMEACVENCGTDYDTGEFYIRIYQYGDVHYEGLRARTDWWTNEVIHESFDGFRIFYEYATFTLRDGEWIITYIGY